MFQRLSNSWKLAKASAAVLRADKELILFPIISLLGLIGVTVLFFLPLAFFESSGGAEGEQIITYIFVFLFYLVQYFVIFFANTALVGAALIRLDGGDPTVGDGFRIAFEHIGSILGYAAISATVGMLLRFIARRGGLIGNLVTSVVGLAWNLATYLVVPVLVAQNVGPIEAIKESSRLLKRTWGENLAGNFGIGVLFVLVAFILILLFTPLIFLVVSSGQTWLIVLTIALAVLSFLVLGLINSALSGIYTATVYHYAANGKVSHYFDESVVANTFKSK